MAHVPKLRLHKDNGESKNKIHSNKELIGCNVKRIYMKRLRSDLFFLWALFNIGFLIQEVLERLAKFID